MITTQILRSIGKYVSTQHKINNYARILFTKLRREKNSMSSKKKQATILFN